MALTNNKIPVDLNRLKFTRLVSESGVGFRHSLYRPPQFRSVFNYTEHVVKDQDVGRLDLLSNLYYKVPYFWWAIAWVNGIKNPLTDMHSVNGERVKASAFLLNTSVENSVELVSKLKGILGNKLKVMVNSGTSVGFLITVILDQEIKNMYDNVLLDITDGGFFIGDIDNQFIDFIVWDSTFPLANGLYDLSGGTNWNTKQVLKIPTIDEIEYALSNTKSNDT